MEEQNFEHMDDAVKALKTHLREMKGIRGKVQNKIALLKRQKIFLNSLTESLYKGLGPDLTKEYKSISNQYRTEYVPYIANKDIYNARLEPGSENWFEPHRLPAKLEKGGAMHLDKGWHTNILN